MATIVTRFRLRRGTAADWTSANPTLLEGEVGYETDTGFMKVGDGSTAWASLDYFTRFYAPVAVGGAIIFDGTGDVVMAPFTP